MRVREAILHSSRQPNGAVTMARITTLGKGKRIIQLIQTKGNQATHITLDAAEYRHLMHFASGQAKRLKKKNPLV